MAVGALGLTHVIEAEFIDQTIADGPGMAEVVLLEALFDGVPEPRHVSARCLEGVERREVVFVREVVVGGEALLVVDAMVKAEGDLILAVVLGEHTHEGTVDGLWYV